VGLLGAGVLMTSACKKNNDNNLPPVDPGTGILENGHASVTGMIVDTADISLSNVQVKINDGTVVYTDNNGMFSVDNASFCDGRIFILCKKDGYFNGSKGVIAHDGDVTKLKIVMARKLNTSSFSSSAGINTVSKEGVHIQIPGDGIATATGDTFNGAVNMTMRYIDPTSTTLSDLMPGGDFRAINNEHKDVQLYSYGAVEVELKASSGENLQLKTGIEATLTIPIAGSQQASAPQTIPLWYFDEVKGKWIEDGSAQKQGNQYLGKVKHFTPWNFDVDGPWAIVKGHVTSCDGSDVGGATVHIGQGAAIADDKGYYEMYVPASLATTGQVTIFSDNSAGSPEVNVAAISANDSKTVNFQTGCGVVTLTGQLAQSDNSPTWGAVEIKTPKGDFTAITGKDGRFYQPVPASAAVSVIGYSHDSEHSAEIALNTPSAGTKDMGKILVAGQQQETGQVSFILNDGGFSNKAIDISSPYNPAKPEAYYVAASDETGIAKAVNGYTVAIGFPGKSTGVPGHATIVLVLPVEKRTLSADSEDGSLILAITKYGAVGDVIEGTFSGKFKQLNSQTAEQYGDVTVSNGVFKIYRGPNQ